MIEQLLPVVPLLLLFLLGYALQRTNFFSTESLSHVKRIVSDLALPALLFQAFSSIELESRYLILVILIFIVCLIMVVLGHYIGKLLKIHSPYFALMMTGFEMGMFGYAVFVSFQGEAHLGKIALVDLGQVVFVFTILMALMIKHRDGAAKGSELLKKIITSPVILAIVAGLATSFIAPHVQSSPIWDTLAEMIDLLAQLTVPLIAITIGYGIHIKKELIGKSLKTILARRVLLTLFALLLNALVVDSWLGMDRMYQVALMTMFLTPPPFVISIYMRSDEEGESDYVDNTLSLDTLVSIVAVVIASALYA
ncbi:MAG: AEC family transporter [Sphaerochaeta sp.]|nr:AEC family transporter [Sphaerochaeta sp.]MDD4647535.1 AEC family transporter [Sphaerochaeta sp.]